jgi:4-amino-4-deoxy-L-arabinose transferase-like glycosyltransferase
MKTPLILFFMALSLRLAAIIFWPFDGLYGQDSFAYLQQAVAITENLPKGEPPPPDFFWPNGYPLLVAFFILFLGQTAQAGQLASLLCGAMLSPLAYCLSQALWLNKQQGDKRSIPEIAHRETRNLTSHRAGIVASFIIAVAGQPILSSVVIMSDIPALFWATLSIWLVVCAGSYAWGGALTPDRWNREKSDLLSPDDLSFRGASARAALLFLAAGAVLALAIISRWIYILVGPALGLYALLSLRRHKKLWGIPFLALFGGAVVLAPQLWLSLNKTEGLFHSWLVGWHPANFFQREFENVDGHFVYSLPGAIFYAQPAGHPAYIFPVLGLAGLWGLWRLWQTKNWEAGLLLLGWAGPVYIFLAGIPYQNFRFGLSLYMPLALLSGLGLSDLWQRLEGQVPLSHTKRFYALWLFKIVMSLSLIGMLLWAYPMLDTFLTTHNRSKQIVYQVEQKLPQGATLITFGLTLTFQHYTQLTTLELFYLDEADLNLLSQTQGPIYLLLDVGNIETQWRSKQPNVNYQWLRTHTTLIRFGTFPPYSLFKVRPCSTNPACQKSR